MELSSSMVSGMPAAPPKELTVSMDRQLSPGARNVGRLHQANVLHSCTTTTLGTYDKSVHIFILPRLQHLPNVTARKHQAPSTRDG